MLNLRHRFAALLLPVMLGCAASAVERAVWKLGEPDRSDHEFTTAADAKTNKDVVVRIGTGNETKAWPGFHPGSGNGAFGGRPYRYVLAFDLPRTAPSGVFYLDVSLLFRQPRVPALEIEINGHRGRYYFKPDPIFELSGFNDQFDPIRSAERRKLALPARFFRPGENILVLVAVDDPPTILTNRTTGGTGDSGFFYDSLALTHDPDAAFEDRLEAELMPTILFPKASQGIRQQGDLLVRFPVSWPGGKARVTAGKFVTQVDTPKPAEFGEARFPVLLPDDTPAGPVRIELSERIFNVRFVPAKKWKLFYAPNEHLDVGYTDYRAKVAEVHARNVDDLLKVLTAHPDYRFNIDGSWITDQWLDLRSPRHTRELAAHARAGQIGMNAFYCCPATEYLSLEENFRNLYFSKELQTRYGVPFDFALISDVPSVSWSVPSVLAAAGVRYFADGGNQHRGPLLVHGRWNVRSPFWWEGPDGQRVLAWFSAHYHQLKSLCGLPPAIESAQGGFARFLRAYEQAGYVPDAVLLYGTEVENLPAEYDDAKFVEQWNARYAYPRLITCRFSEFFQYIEKNYATNLPVVRGTGGAYWADNFGALPAATARDRANQMRVLSAESLATLTTTLDPKLRFSHELDRDIWRNILLYSEHNFGTGRATGQPESDEVVGILTEKENWTAEAEHDIDRLMRRSLSQLADQIQTEGRNLVVFNPLSWQRSALVRFQVDNGTTLTNVATGRPVPCEVVSEKDGYQNIRFWAEELPPLGYKVYRLGHVANQGVGSVKKVAQASRPRVDGDLPPHGSSVVGGGTPPTPAGETPALLSVVENRFYKITLDPARAAIRSLYDKELGRELVDGSSPYLLNEYLFVSGGGTETGRGRGAEDTRLLDTFRWLPQADLTVHHPENGVLSGIERTPWGQKIR
ncbi:MAG TPA: hypothetical protein VN578_13545, partial [Candidatus Binatia bacterium]|nr:hypothetical protein [Candidatus Binatia bacterium]